MKTVAVVGLGNMGSGLVKNLLKAGFDVRGWDIVPEKVQAHRDSGGIGCATSAEAGDGAEAAFIMVMNGDQVKEVIFGQHGLLKTMKPSSSILITATIHAREAREIGRQLSGSGIHLVDSPVSGGQPGAQGGTLTLMAAASEEAFEAAAPAMEAVSSTIHKVGTDIGQGQTVKACLQSLIGSIFTATYEASVLAAKAGVNGEAFHKVVSTSAAGCGIASGSLENIIANKFQGTGSHIDTMYKDLTISVDLAREKGVPLFTASTAMQLFQAGKTRHPDGDNQVVTKVLEGIVGAGLRS